MLQPQGSARRPKNSNPKPELISRIIPPTWERLFLAGLVVAFGCFVGYLILRDEPMCEQTWKLVSLVAALLAAGVGAFLTGMFEVNGKRPGLAIRATGALGLFVMVMWWL